MTRLWLAVKVGYRTVGVWPFAWDGFVESGDTWGLGFLVGWSDR